MSISNSFASSEISVPCVIQDGVFGATVNKNGTPLFLRMELLTEENSKNWARFREMSCWVANDNNRGVLSGLVRSAGKAHHPKYEVVKDVTGFTEEEFALFTEKAVSLKEKTANKIVGLLEANCVGITHMYIGTKALNYIAYISKDRNFSILNTDITKEMSLKNFVESYSDILISMGSDFSAADSFHNRGISRNPHCVFEEKYSGLSMLLHGFTGAIAKMFFPEKTEMTVKAIGSMQCIIKKNLFPKEGYIENDGREIDLTNVEISEDAPQGEMSHITIAALNRLYHSSVK